VRSGARACIRLGLSVHRGKKEVPEGGRAFLLPPCGAHLGYFGTISRAGSLSAAGMCRRRPRRRGPPTSPTNIALAFFKRGGGVGPGALRRDEARSSGKMLGSLERLEKWPGQPYNWYDTRTSGPCGRATSRGGQRQPVRRAHRVRETLREWNEPALRGRAARLRMQWRRAALRRTETAFSIASRGSRPFL
jgi:hypothetical protein